MPPSHSTYLLIHHISALWVVIYSSLGEVQRAGFFACLVRRFIPSGSGQHLAHSWCSKHLCQMKGLTTQGQDIESLWRQPQAVLSL